MYTERELPLILARSNSSVASLATVFNAQTSRPETARVFTLSNFKSGKLTGGVVLGIGFLLFVMFLGRS